MMEEEKEEEEEEDLRSHNGLAQLVSEQDQFTYGESGLPSHARRYTHKRLLGLVSLGHPGHHLGLSLCSTSPSRLQVYTPPLPPRAPTQYSLRPPAG